MKRIVFLDLNSLMTCFGEVIQALSWFFFLSNGHLHLPGILSGVLKCNNPGSVTICQRRNHICQILFVKHMSCWSSERKKEKLAVIVVGILLWTSELCKLLLGVICLIKLCESSPRTLGFMKRFLCPDVSEPLCVRCCTAAEWKEWSNGRSKANTMPCCTLQCVLFWRCKPHSVVQEEK